MILWESPPIVGGLTGIQSLRPWMKFSFTKHFTYFYDKRHLFTVHVHIYDDTDTWLVLNLHIYKQEAKVITLSNVQVYVSVYQCWLQTGHWLHVLTCSSCITYKSLRYTCIDDFVISTCTYRAWLCLVAQDNV